MGPVDNEPVLDLFTGSLTETTNAQSIFDMEFVPPDGRNIQLSPGFVSPEMDMRLPQNEWMFHTPFAGRAGIPDDSTTWPQVFDVQDPGFWLPMLQPSHQLPSSEELNESGAEGQDVAGPDFSH